MKKVDLSQAVKHFKIQALTKTQILAMIQDRAEFIKPIFERATLQRLCNLPAFTEITSLVKISDCDPQKIEWMLNINTEGVFAKSFCRISRSDRAYQNVCTNKFCGLTRDFRWCYGTIQFIPKGNDYELRRVSFYYLDLSELMGLWEDWKSLYNVLGNFILEDRKRAKNRLALVEAMATRIEFENMLMEKLED